MLRHVSASSRHVDGRRTMSSSDRRRNFVASSGYELASLTNSSSLSSARTDVISNYVTHKEAEMLTNDSAEHKQRLCHVDVKHDILLPTPRCLPRHGAIALQLRWIGDDWRRGREHIEGGLHDGGLVKIEVRRCP